MTLPPLSVIPDLSVPARMKRRAQRRRCEAAPEQRAEPLYPGRRASERPQPRPRTRSGGDATDVTGFTPVTALLWKRQARANIVG